MPGSVICDDDHARIKKMAVVLGLALIVLVAILSFAQPTHKSTPGSVIERTARV